MKYQINAELVINGETQTILTICNSYFVAEALHNQYVLLGFVNVTVAEVVHEDDSRLPSLLKRQAM